jgi:hypothetical protein
LEVVHGLTPKHSKDRIVTVTLATLHRWKTLYNIEAPVCSFCGKPLEMNEPVKHALSRRGRFYHVDCYRGMYIDLDRENRYTLTEKRYRALAAKSSTIVPICQFCGHALNIGDRVITKRRMWKGKRSRRTFHIDCYDQCKKQRIYYKEEQLQRMFSE